MKGSLMILLLLVTMVAVNDAEECLCIPLCYCINRQHAVRALAERKARDLTADVPQVNYEAEERAENDGILAKLGIKP